MKTVLSLAAVAALFVAFHNARAVEDPPAAHLQLVEVEQQTPYLESFAGVTAGTATVSVIRRVVAGRHARARPTRSSTTTTATAAARRSRSTSTSPTPTASRPRW